jgi:hypothetical protein
MRDMTAALSNRELKRAQRRARRAAVPPGGPEATARALARLEGARAIIFVEGLSDQIAVETLAVRRGRDLEAEGVVVVPIGGAHAIGRFAGRFPGRDLVGLCHAGEEAVFRRNLERVHVCVADLEDELIRALGAAGVEAVIEAEGDLPSFRTFQKQPAWRGRPVEAQLRRWLGSADRRSLRYARVLVEALDLERVPAPLDGVLASCPSAP